MQPVDTPESLRPVPPAPSAPTDTQPPVVPPVPMDALPPMVPPAPTQAPPQVLPPAPPAFDPRPTTMQLQLLGGMFGLGTLLALIGGLGDFRYDTHIELGGTFLATYAALVTLSWLPPSVLTRRVDKLIDRWVRNSATGYYGVMALGAFVTLEVSAFIDNVLAFELDVQAILMHRLIGFSVESMKNLGLAFGWPALVLKNGQAFGALVLVAATWSIFHATARVLPHATFRKRKEKKAKKSKRKD